MIIYLIVFKYFVIFCHINPFLEAERLLFIKFSLKVHSTKYQYNNDFIYSTALFLEIFDFK